MSHPSRTDDSDDYDDRPRPRRRRPEESDDDDEQVARRRPAKSGQGTTIVLVLAGTLLGVMLICGGVALYVYNSVVRGLNQVRQDMDQNMERMRVEGEKRRAEEKQAEENSDKAKARRLVERFVAELRADRSDAAYQLTTDGYRGRVPLNEFTTLAAVFTAEHNALTSMKEDFFAPATGTVYRFDSFGPGDKIALTAVREGDEWRIDRFSVTKK